MCVDLSDWNATRKAVESVGDVDLLVNNAAISIGLVSCLEASPQDFDTQDHGVKLGNWAISYLFLSVQNDEREREGGDERDASCGEADGSSRQGWLNRFRVEYSLCASTERTPPLLQYEGSA